MLLPPESTATYTVTLLLVNCVTLTLVRVVRGGGRTCSALINCCPVLKENRCKGLCLKKNTICYNCSHWNKLGEDCLFGSTRIPFCVSFSETPRRRSTVSCHLKNNRVFLYFVIFCQILAESCQNWHTMGWNHWMSMLAEFCQDLAEN